MVSVGLELGDLVGSRISGFRYQYFEVNAFCQEVVYTSEGISLGFRVFRTRNTCHPYHFPL